MFDYCSFVRFNIIIIFIEVCIIIVIVIAFEVGKYALDYIIVLV